MKKDKTIDFRQYYLVCLEKINKFDSSNRAWVTSRVQAQADQICKDKRIGDRFNYDGVGEIGMGIGKFGV